MELTEDIADYFLFHLIACDSFEGVFYVIFGNIKHNIFDNNSSN